MEIKAKHCQFKCNDKNCNAEETIVRGQILIGTNNDEIRDGAVNCLWGLGELRQEGMKMESAARSGASNLKGNKNKIKDDSKAPEKKTSNINCFNCGSKISRSIANHKSKCPAKTQ